MLWFRILKKSLTKILFKHFADFHGIAKENADYIEKNVKEKYEKIVEEEKENQIVINLKGFNNCEPVIKKHIVRYTINKVLGNIQGIGLIHIEDIIKMCDKEIGNKFLLPNKKIRVSINNKKIFFEAIWASVRTFFWHTNVI